MILVSVRSALVTGGLTDGMKWRKDGTDNGPTATAGTVSNEILGNRQEE